MNDFKLQNVDYFNAEMEFGLQLNIALIYEGLKMYEDARQKYLEIVQKENYYSPGIMKDKIRINIGNLYYRQGDYPKAIIEWKKAVDKISKDNKEMRGLVLRNIANAQIKLGSYEDAIDNYTESVKHKEDMKTCKNLLLSNLANCSKISLHFFSSLLKQNFSKSSQFSSATICISISKNKFISSS